MPGKFDAAEALRAGLHDRYQAWEFIRQFAAAWTKPFRRGDGLSDGTLWGAEQRIGVELPAALREAYLLSGGRADLTAEPDRLVPAQELGLDYSGTAVVFRDECQHVAEWGVAVADLGSPDPPVYQQMALPEYRAWYNSDLTMRWFSGPGKLLCMHGRKPGCVLMAGGQTLADLRSIKATVPGPWISVKWA